MHGHDPDEEPRIVSLQSGTPLHAPVALTGELAAAYAEYVEAARNLEGKRMAAAEAVQRAQAALTRFTKLAAGVEGR